MFMFGAAVSLSKRYQSLPPDRRSQFCKARGKVIFGKAAASNQSSARASAEPVLTFPLSSTSRSNHTTTWDTTAVMPDLIKLR
jgi:hypothetical protein